MLVFTRPSCRIETAQNHQGLALVGGLKPGADTSLTEWTLSSVYNASAGHHWEQRNDEKSVSVLQAWGL